MWREICHLREFGAEVIVYATRPPPARDRARHAFAAEAARATRYLWPRPVANVATDAILTLARSPLTAARAVKQLASLPLSGRTGLRTALPIVLAAAEMAAMARRDGIDHVHVASAARCALIAMSLKSLVGMPFSLTINANVSWWGGAMREKFEAADLVVSIADWLCGDIRAVVPDLPSERLILAPVGVDTRGWPWVARSWPSAGEPIRLVSVGRLHLSKGHDTLISAVAQLAEEGMAVRLRILGDGPDRPRLEALIGESKLGQIVQLLGSVDEATVRREIGASHIFALASHAEPLGVVYMEAMATGIPTIGTDAGGVREIIADGVTGYLVPARSPAVLASTIRAITLDPQRALRVGAAGRAFIEQHFDSRIGAERLLHAIRRVSAVGSQAHLQNRARV